MNLTTQSFRIMQNEFKRYGHHPSREQLEALRDIHETLTAQADGRAEPAYYVCSVDPGVGKSLAIRAWIRAFLDDTDYDHIGLLLCVDRYDEIEAFANSISEADCVAIVTSGHPLNDLGLGAEKSDQARVLFTTKEQLRRRSRGRCFTEVSKFFFQSRPRHVRIWDESLLVGEPLVIRRTSLGTLLDPVAHDQNLVDLIDEIITSVRDHRDGSTFVVPRLPVSKNHWLHLFSDQPDHVKETAYTIWRMNARKVTVRMSLKGPVLLDTVEVIPRDFKPCLVTDASARINSTYGLHERHRSDLVWLKKALRITRA